jgi:D-3-phosphoglycerate dehydrogenase
VNPIIGNDFVKGTMMNEFKVALIANDDHPIPAWVDEKFKQAGISWAYKQCYNRNDLKEIATDANVLWLMSGRKGLVIEENMDIFKNLIAVVRIGSGTDNIDHDACNKRGIIIGHSPEIMIECTSDHMIAMLFSAVRRIAVHDKRIRVGIFNPREPMSIGYYKNAKLGIIGFGKIAKAVIKKLSGFEMDVKVFDPYVEQIDIVKAGCKKVELSELLKESQFIIVACPLTDSTNNLLGENEFKLMRKDAVLVNCARGGIVNDNALLNALKNKTIAAAAIDVYSKTPPDSSGEIFKLENVNFTPHSAGYPLPYPDMHYRGQIDVIIDISKGKTPQWIANKSVLNSPNLKLKNKQLEKI